MLLVIVVMRDVAPLRSQSNWERNFLMRFRLRVELRRLPLPAPELVWCQAGCENQDLTLS